MRHRRHTRLSLANVVIVTLLNTAVVSSRCSNPEVNYKEYHLHGKHLETGSWKVNLGNITVRVEHSGKPELRSLGTGRWEVSVKLTSTSCETYDIEDKGSFIEEPEDNLLPVDVSTPSIDNEDGFAEEFLADDSIRLLQPDVKPRTNVLSENSNFEREVIRPTFKSAFQLGYEIYGKNGMVKLFQNSLPWGLAKKRCEQDGAHLASVDSQEKVAVLLDVFSNYPRVAKSSVLKNQVYIGINDLDEEGVFKTATGKVFKPWNESVWFPHQPDNEGGIEDCVTFHTMGRIRDVPCHFSLPFFCVIDYETISEQP